MLLKYALPLVFFLVGALGGKCRPSPIHPTAGPLWKPNSPNKLSICDLQTPPPILKSVDPKFCGKDSASCSGDRLERPAPRIFVTGRVLDEECNPIANATLDLWQPSPEGVYSSIHPDEDEGNCRSMIFTNTKGEYSFESYRAGTYGITAGSLSWDHAPWGPQHIHVAVFAPGFKVLMTQLYNDDDNAIYHDLREKLGGQKLYADDLDSQLHFKPCSAEQQKLGRELCASFDFVLIKRTDGRQLTYHEDLYENTCGREFNPGHPIPLCYGKFLWVFRSRYIFSILACIVLLVLLTAFFVLRCICRCACRKSQKAKTN